MKQQKRNLPRSFPTKLILDSTIIIHVLSKDWFLSDEFEIIIPSNVSDELKSFESNLVLSLLETKENIQFISPSDQALSQAVTFAKQVGEYSRLSNYDLNVLAIALEHSDYTIISDDNAIQNVCKHYGIKFSSSFFKISKTKKYFWKCTVCGAKYKKKREYCIDCGSLVKRYYQ